MCVFHSDIDRIDSQSLSSAMNVQRIGFSFSYSILEFMVNMKWNRVFVLVTYKKIDKVLI